MHGSQSWKEKVELSCSEHRTMQCAATCGPLLVNAQMLVIHIDGIGCVLAVQQALMHAEVCCWQLCERDMRQNPT
jgi:hypothetical protein